MNRIADHDALRTSMRLFFYGTLMLIVHLRLGFEFDLINDVIGAALIVAAVLKLFQAIPDARQHAGALLPLAAFVVVGTAITQVYVSNPVIAVTTIIEAVGALLLARYLHPVFAHDGPDALAADWEQTADRLLWFGVVPYVALTTASVGNLFGSWLWTGLWLLVAVVGLVGGLYAGFLLLRSLRRTSTLSTMPWIETW